MFWADTVYGTSPQIPSVGVAAVTEPMGVSATHRGGAAGLVDPHNPLFWFGALMLLTVGAAGVSGSARFGPVHVGASAGKT